MRTVQKSLGLLLPLLVAALPARAAVTHARPDGFLIDVAIDIAATPARAYAALGEVGRWWSPGHTWSGEPANLSLSLAAGSCFCERWESGSVEHARVIFAKQNELLRLDGALGPLQSMGVTGVVTFAFEPTPGGTKLHFSQRVSGDPVHSLDQIAPFADQMMVETAGRFVRFVETGKPD